MILKFYYILFFIIILTVILFNQGCENKIVDPPISNTIDTVKSYTHFLWPSKKGSYWIYDYYTFPFGNSDSSWTYNNFNSFGFQLDTININGIFNLEIIDTAYFNINDTLFASHVIASYYNDKSLNFNEVYWIGREGVFSLGAFNEQGDTLLKKGIYIPAEIQINNSWGSQSIFRGPSGFSAVIPVDKKLISLNDTIEISSGKFECYVIRTVIDPKQDYPGYYYYYEYFVPNLGLIAKIRIFLVPNAYWSLDYIYVLKDYKLNN